MGTGTTNNKDDIQVKKVNCWAAPGCGDQCGLLVSVKEGQIVKMTGNRETINGRQMFHSCPDRLPYLIKWLHHPDQLMYPLKRAGERGENRWERISWDQALDEIADKLKQLKADYGAESLAVTEGTWRSDLYPMRTRFLSLFGNPINIGDAGVVCNVNKAILRRSLLGTTALSNTATRCTVFDGSNISESGRRRWLGIKERVQKGETKLIVIDPRETEIAKHAAIWLQIRPGTDCALFLAWINIIIEERLYDEEFINKWTFGFEQLKQRVAEYSPEKVAEITWIPADKIRESARMYAISRPATFGGGVAPDEIGLNGTRIEQVKVCLRAITGNLRTDGGETPLGPGLMKDSERGIRDWMLQLDEHISTEQRNKQIGADRFKLMTWPAYGITSKIYRERYDIGLSMTGHELLSSQPLIWRAVLKEEPYPVKAMITWCANPLVNAANTKLVYQALKSTNLDLHVVLEHFMTPTALLADYVLPAASKLERSTCNASFDFLPMLFRCGERAIPPLGERRSDYIFWRELAIRMGFSEYFPWEDEEELADYRLKPMGITFKEAAMERYMVTSDETWTYETLHPDTGETMGFATPTGKVELYSTILEELGYDPLPFYEEPPESSIRTPEVAKEYPLILTTGGRYRPFFHSEQRQLGTGMREQHPYPLMDIHPDTAKKLGITDGDWAYIETRRGVIKQKARLTTGIDPRVVNVEALWWYPEMPAQEPWLHGLWESNANVLTMDDPDSCDPLTGGWALRALLCKVYKVQTP